MSKFCKDCGRRLDNARKRNDDGRGKLHVDVAHPINSECRDLIQTVVIDAYNAEMEKQKDDPDYQPESDADVLDRYEAEPISKEEPTEETVASDSVAADVDVQEDVVVEPVEVVEEAPVEKKRRFGFGIFS